ncbi:MAG: DNA polymerase III, partial [Nanoarchaeota archaeon]
PEIQFNFNEIFKTCKENKIALEINSFPERLDLRDMYIRDAVNNNVKMIINTDSHDVDHFRFIKYGIAQARRGWCSKNDIINTYDLSKFKKFFNIR